MFLQIAILERKMKIDSFILVSIYLQLIMHVVFTQLESTDSWNIPNVLATVGTKIQKHGNTKNTLPWMWTDPNKLLRTIL